MVNCSPSQFQLSLTFHALADGTRRSIVQRLGVSDCTISEIAEPFEISMPAITKHVKVLAEAGLVSKRREGKFTVCRLERENLDAANDWITKQKAYWESQLDGLGEYLDKQKQAKTTTPRNSTKKKGKRP